MELSKRKNHRLKDYDYSQNGAYFITVCINNRKEILWDVGARIARPQDSVNLSKYGMVIEEAIKNIPKHYSCVSVDKYCIMPNHLHMILVLPNEDGRAMRAPTIARVINQFKGYVTKQIGFPLWQKSFYDEIIRNQGHYDMIWQYIDTNPLKWDEDELNNNLKITER